MIIDNDPPIERHISIPRDMSQLSCSSFTAGIVEAVMDGLGFVRAPVRGPILPRSYVIQARSCYCSQHTDNAVSFSDDDTEIEPYEVLAGEVGESGEYLWLSLA